MADFSVPAQTEYTVLTPDVYEGVVIDFEEVANDKGEFAYDPETMNANRATQLHWTGKIREGKDAGEVVTWFTGAYFSRNSKNKLKNYQSSIDPDFSIDKCYPSTEAMHDAVRNKPVRFSIGNNEGKKKRDDGTFPVYNKVKDLLPTKLTALTGAEVATLILGGVTLAEEEIRF